MSLSALLLASVIASPTTFKVVELYPTDDVWAYPHASDAAKDEVLRVWGIGGKAVWDSGEEPDSYCITLMKFDVKPLAGTKIKSATLTLTHAETEEMKAEWTKKSPLEVRPSTFNLVEKDWVYGKVNEARPNPDLKFIYGTGFPETIPKDKPFPIVIDLMKEPSKFALHYATASVSSEPQLTFALTTTLDPSELGRGAVYKFFSKDHENKAYRPVLKLELE